MPLYEYQCDACGHCLEHIQKFSDPLLTVCPKCGGTIRKLVSSPAIQFKGTGWYVTDYAKKGSGAEADKSSDGAEADKSSDGKDAKTAKSDKTDAKSGGATSSSDSSKTKSKSSTNSSSPTSATEH